MKRTFLKCVQIKILKTLIKQEHNTLGLLRRFDMFIRQKRKHLQHYNYIIIIRPTYTLILFV